MLLELANAALGAYDLPAGTVAKMLNLSENATYRVDAPDGRRFALRVHRDGYHSRQAIASELAWEIDLRRTGVVTTPNPIKGRDGEIIQDIAHPRMKRPRHVVLFDWETGAEPGIGEDLSGPFEVLGEITARACTSMRGNGRGRPGSPASPGISTQPWARTIRIGAAGATVLAWTARKKPCSSARSISSAAG